MDRRIHKTQQAIYQAFLDLLRRKPFDKVTVTDIIAQANVGRSTFYDHFKTKDALLAKVCHDLFEHTFVERHVPSDPEEMTQHLFYHFKENKDKVTTLLLSQNSYFQRQFAQYLIRYLFPLLKEAIEQAYPNVPQTYREELFATQFMMTLTWWLKQPQPADETMVARYFLQVVTANQWMS